MQSSSSSFAVNCCIQAYTGQHDWLIFAYFDAYSETAVNVLALTSTCALLYLRGPSCLVASVRVVWPVPGSLSVWLYAVTSWFVVLCTPADTSVNVELVGQSWRRSSSQLYSTSHDCCATTSLPDTALNSVSMSRLISLATATVSTTSRFA